MGTIGTDPRESAEDRGESLAGATVDDSAPSEPSAKPALSDEEMARIALAAREAKTTVIAVGALTIGSIIFMFLITLVAFALKYF